MWKSEELRHAAVVTGVSSDELSSHSKQGGRLEEANPGPFKVDQRALV